MKNNSELPDLEVFINFIESLKLQGKVYNDADFCQKTGIPRTYLSDIKSGRRTITENVVLKVQRVFPEFLCSDVDTRDKDLPTIGDLARMIEDHDKRFHQQMNRIMDAMGFAEHERKKENVA